jgi:choline-phosphate cytidylyltransferase
VSQQQRRAAPLIAPAVAPPSQRPPERGEPVTPTGALEQLSDSVRHLPHPRVITFGTFDVLHIGHLRILERARLEGASLIAGVSTDALNWWKKAKQPVYPEAERLAIVGALRCVDVCFLEYSLADKAAYVLAAGASVLVMGDDWTGRFDELPRGCEAKYLPRTPSVSTTATIERIRRPSAGV